MRKTSPARVAGHRAVKNHGGAAAAKRLDSLQKLESRTELREAATGYAQGGWRVLPLHTIIAGKCSCGTTCSSPGKHPRTKHGVKDATVDLGTINEWWSDWPDANVGVATGNGLAVLDIDPDKGGEDSLRELLDSHEPWDTSVVATGGGGLHFYFKSDKAIRNNVGVRPGIDVRGQAGYVVAPPSNHASGGTYTWQKKKTELAPWPSFDFSRRKPKTKPISEKGIAEGERNAKLASLAGTMRHRGMSEEAIAAALLEENKRCLPPLAEEEVRLIATSISKYAPAPGQDPADPQGDSGSKVDDGETDGMERKQQAALLVKLASAAELFHTPDEEAYASLSSHGHRETWRVGGRMFQRWLSHRFYEASRKAPNGGAMSDALRILEAMALFEGQKHTVFIRVARHDERTMYLDLVNDSWQAVEITSEGWKVVSNPPVRFQRARGMLPLPAPEDGGSIDELRRFLNVPGETEWVLVVAWLVGALRPERPYPVLVLQGEQGSAKSTTARFLRDLIDPNAVPLRDAPREARDLMIAATNAYAIVFDNLSHVQQWLSDTLCRLATGGGFATRELYTDREEVLFQADRPVLLNGIEELATRGDLLDRSLVVSLPPIPESRRQAERALIGEFDRLRPRILGALLDAVVAALRNLDKTAEMDLPRMADFALWMMAAEPGLGWKSGTFMAAYRTNREVANEVAIEASPIATPLLALLAQEGDFERTPGDLLRMINERADPNAMRKRGWPQTPSHLSGMLKRLAPNLRSAAVEVDWFRRGGKRFIHISRRLPADGGVQAVQGVQFEDLAEADLDGADGADGDVPAADDDPMLRAAIDVGLVPPDAEATDS
jgi:hypothetical protein